MIKNRILFSIIVFIFSLKIFSTDSLDNSDVNQNFLCDSLIQILQENDEIDPLKIAQDLLNNHLKELMEINEKIDISKFRKKYSDIPQFRIAENYFPFPTTCDQILKEFVQTPNGRSRIQNHIRNTKEFLQVNITSLKILINSFNYAINNKDPALLILLTHECIRLYSTTSQDLKNYLEEQPKVLPFFLSRQNLAQSILALLLMYFDIDGTKKSILEGDNDGLIANLYNGISKDILYKIILNLLYEKLGNNDNENELFDFEEDELAKLIKQNKIPEIHLSEKAKDTLKNTQLFKILDTTPRKNYVNKLVELENYHIFLGTIDDFLYPPKPVSVDNKKTLSKKPRTNKRGQKKPRYKAPKITSNDSIKTDEITPTIEKAEPISIIQIKKDETGNKEEELNSSQNQEFVILSSLEGKQKIEPILKDELIYQFPPSYNDFVDERQIEESYSTSYYFDGQLFSNEDLFFELKENISAKKSKAINSLFAETRHYKNRRHPNIASYFIRSHIIDPSNNKKTKIFKTPYTYVSGARKFIYEDEIDFKKRNNIKSAFNDFLDKKEKEQYWNAKEVRSIFLKNKIFTKSKKNVDGPWYYNALDTESLIFLDLIDNQLENLVKDLSEGSTIKGVVIGIESLYKSCYRCGNLMQGYQRVLHNKLKMLAQKYGLNIDEETPNMIIVDGKLLPNRPVDMFMRSNNSIPEIYSNDENPKQQFRLIIKEEI